MRAKNEALSSNQELPRVCFSAVAAYWGALCICGRGRGGGASDGEVDGADVGGSAGVMDGGVYCIGGAVSSDESSVLALSSGLSSSPVCA
jgi:hypothetical protein